MYIIDKDKIGKTYYTYSDHLGSIISITDNNGAIIPNGEQSFDPWGRKRNPNNWSYDSIPDFTLLDRGYTGHEYLAEFGLINMNGRVYDPILGRVLSPDPILQDPTNTQNFNRYSYCFNNPLKYTDPSGYLTSANFWDYFDYLWNMGTDGSPEARSSGGHVKGFTDNGSTNGGGGDASGTGDEGSSGSSEHGSDRLTSSFWNTKIGQAILKLCGYNIMQSYAGAGVYVTFNTYNTSSSDNYFLENFFPDEVINTSAFLLTIRQTENNGNEPLGYNSSYGGGTFTNNSYSEAPQDYAEHPNKLVTKWGQSSTAAGAYQFLNRTWIEQSEELGLTDFSPKSQDIAAIAYIKKNGALKYVITGDLDRAVKKLDGIWTSLAILPFETIQQLYNANLLKVLNFVKSIKQPKRR